MTIKNQALIAAMLIAAGIGVLSAQAPVSKAMPQTVLFVCEHGAAKSVIAAAHFNKIARERGLPYRAAARGTAPDASIPAGVKQGLERDGLELVVQKPAMVGQADVNVSNRVITFEIGLPAAISTTNGSLTDWRGVPSVSADFGVASAEIRRRVEALIDELAKK